MQVRWKEEWRGLGWRHNCEPRTLTEVTGGGRRAVGMSLSWGAAKGRESSGWRAIICPFGSEEGPPVH